MVDSWPILANPLVLHHYAQERRTQEKRRDLAARWTKCTDWRTVVARRERLGRQGAWVSQSQDGSLIQEGLPKLVSITCLITVDVNLCLCRFCFFPILFPFQDILAVDGPVIFRFGTSELGRSGEPFHLIWVCCNGQVMARIFATTGGVWEATQLHVIPCDTIHFKLNTPDVWDPPSE